MKKITLISVGRLKEKFYQDAAAEYIKRLQKFCDMTVVELKDFAVDSVRRESEAILAAANDHGKGRFWLLDLGGENYTSPQFSHVLDKEFLTGGVTFVIGGSMGVSQQVRQSAAKRISFGAFTYPHQLVRVMLLEQIYRAMSIEAGLPYHK